MGPFPFRSAARPHGEPRTERGRDAVADLDLSGQPVGLHPARRVHGVAQRS
jgi:hypothetical protein